MFLLASDTSNGLGTTIDFLGNFFNSILDYFNNFWDFISRMAKDTVEFFKFTWLIVEVPVELYKVITFGPLVLCISVVVLVGLIKVALGWGNT